MLFISREKSPSFVIVHGEEEFSGGVRIRTKKPAVLQFEALEQPFQVAHLPVKDGVAKGYLRTEKAAKEVRKSGHAYMDEEGKDVTEFRIIDFLFNQKGYGVDFVAVGTKTGQEILSKDRYIIEQPDESEFSHYCRLCKKSFKSLAGAEGHCSSKDHQDALKQAEQQAWDSFK